MTHVTRETRVAFESLDELTDHLVERLSELLDFAVGSIHLESRRERAVGDQRGREGDLLERANGPARDPDAAAHAHDRGEERPETEHECQQAQGLFQVGELKHLEDLGFHRGNRHADHEDDVSVGVQGLFGRVTGAHRLDGGLLHVQR